MKDPAHPPVDLLADHHEGFVTGARAVAIAAHLDLCTECRSLVAALDEVTDVLAAEGSHAPPMPASVASSLDQALARASAERASGVPSLAERREAHRPPPPAAQRRPAWPLLAAAAAVVVIASTVGVGVLIEGSGGSADSSAGSSQDSSERRKVGEDAGEAAPTPTSTPDSPAVGADPPSVDTVQPGELAELARDLDSGARQPVRPQRSCATPTERYGDGPVSLVVFDGGPAVAVLDVKTRTVTVLDCDSARTKLFATGY
ncbi:MAG: hypothetical protein M3Q82_04715 [Actinomycetota bacterium]|nr:hypothetical protein [Actinomycetota bacterium]